MTNLLTTLKPVLCRSAATLAVLAALGAAAGCVSTTTVAPPPSMLDDRTTRLVATACPPALAGVDARCLAARDAAGAWLLVAVPAAWNGTLVVHAHGGPTLGEPQPARAVEDLTRWSIMVKAGYAWAGTSFAQGGVAVRAAAADVERMRRIVVAQIGQPRRTILHGQSWGAGVAAVGASAYGGAAADGRFPYDAVLLTNGVLGGGSRSYDFRLDLRVVYQYLCSNHPRADEPAYPLWQGCRPTRS